MSAEVAGKVVDIAFDSILNLALMAWGYWFGYRAGRKP